MPFVEKFVVHTEGRSVVDITARVQAVVANGPADALLASIFVHHTSCSLLITENADPDVRVDLEAFFLRLIPDGDPLYRHRDEGPDDMPSHIRAAITATNLSIPILSGSCDLGTWQGIFLWEHRVAPHDRRITVTLL